MINLILKTLGAEMSTGRLMSHPVLTLTTFWTYRMYSVPVCTSGVGWVMEWSVCNEPSDSIQRDKFYNVAF
jgi:hypothetical protein